MGRRPDGLAWPNTYAQSAEEALFYLSPRYPVVQSDFTKDGRQGAHPKRATGRNRDSVLARCLRQTEMTARLTDDRIAVMASEQRGQFASAQVAG